MAFAWNTVRLQSTLPAAAKRGKPFCWLYVHPVTLCIAIDSQQSYNAALGFAWFDTFLDQLVWCASLNCLRIATTQQDLFLESDSPAQVE